LVVLAAGLSVSLLASAQNDGDARRPRAAAACRAVVLDDVEPACR
jgi:hypothetical protein